MVWLPRPNIENTRADSSYLSCELLVTTTSVVVCTVPRWKPDLSSNGHATILFITPYSILGDRLSAIITHQEKLHHKMMIIYARQKTDIALLFTSRLYQYQLIAQCWSFVSDTTLITWCTRKRRMGISELLRLNSFFLFRIAP